MTAQENHKEHAELSAAFNRDEQRVNWHDKTLWFIREKRDKAAWQIPEWEALREQASQIKENVLSTLHDYLLQFEQEAIRQGIRVHWASTPEEHNSIVYNIIKKNITYPAQSRADHKYGSVLVRFVVNEDGSLSDMEILESPDELLGKEALRVLGLSPEWVPAKRDGVPIKQQMVLPIEFKLDFPGKVTVVTPQKENTTTAGEQKTSRQKALMETSLEQVVVVGYSN